MTTRTHRRSSQLARHRDRAGDIFPAVAQPEFAAAGIIAGDENDGALQSCRAQSIHAGIEQELTNLPPTVRGRDREMVNPSASAIVTAKRGADDFPVGFGDL